MSCQLNCMSKSHVVIRVEKNSEYIRRYCPIRRQPISPGEQVIVCSESGQVFSLAGYEEVADLWRGQCSFCSRSLNITSLPQEKKLSHTQTRRPVIFPGVLLLLGAVLIVLMGGALLIAGGAVYTLQVAPSQFVTPISQPTSSNNTYTTPSSIAVAPIVTSTSTTIAVAPIVTSASTTTSFSNAFSCPGAPSSRVAIGMKARVTFTNGIPLRIRTKPSINKSTWIKSVPEGTQMNILHGPECVDGYIWWKVKAEDGTVGWVAEGEPGNYFIEPWGG